MVISMLPQAGNLPNIKKAIMSINCNWIARDNALYAAGALVYMGSWKELSQRVTHFLCLIIIKCDMWTFAVYKACPCATSVNLHGNSTKWALFSILQKTKMKFRVVNQCALITPNTHTFTKPTESEEVVNPKQKYI